MLLKTISKSVSIDQIISRNSEKYIYFITHPDQSFVVTENWRSPIYTSQHIAVLLSSKMIPIPLKYFKILRENEEHVITAPDKTKLRVRMFLCDPLRANVLFYFESSSLKIVYSGPLIDCRLVLLNDRFRNCVLAGIDELYVDNVRAHSTNCETATSIARAICDIAKNHPGYVLIMHAPAFGYEDVICTLVKEYGLKVFVGQMIRNIFKRNDMDQMFASSMQEANIIVGEGHVTVEQLKRRFNKQKRLTIFFTESNYEIKSLYENFGLYQLNYTPHPSLFDLYALISFVRPRSLHGIHSDMPSLPSNLKSLCRNDALRIVEGYESEIVDSNGIKPSSQSNRNRIELPRHVISSKSRTINGELLSNVAIIKPTLNEKVIEVMEKVLTEPSNEIFNRSLSNVSFTDCHLDDLLSVRSESGDIHNDMPSQGAINKSAARLLRNETQQRHSSQSKIRKSQVDLPRHVICSQPKNLTGELLSKIAIIKPTEPCTRNNELEDIEEEHNSDIFNEELTYLSVSENCLASLSSLSESDVDEDSSDDIFARSLISQSQKETDKFQLKLPSPKRKRINAHPNNRTGLNLTTASSKFVELKSKTKSFSRRPPNILYYSDES